MGISMVMENVEDFTALLESKFNDAVNEAVKTEDERISRSIPLEKADKFPQVLKYAKAWSFVLNVLAGIIFFMALFYPEPPDMFMWALTFIPVAAIISIKLFKGIIRLSGTIGSSYPQMTMALLFCSMGLFVRSLFDTNPLNYENLLPVGALASMIFAIFCLLFVKEVREKSSNIIFAAVVSLLFGFSTAAHYNEQLDSSDPELYQAEVLDKQKTSDEAGGYCVTLAAWGPHPGQNDQNIDKALFDRLKVGDKVSVYLMEGRFKVPWVDIK